MCLKQTYGFDVAQNKDMQLFNNFPMERIFSIQIYFRHLLKLIAAINLVVRTKQTMAGFKQ